MSKYFCGKCKLEINLKETSICCNGICKLWHHVSCTNLSRTDIQKFIKDLSKPNGERWVCDKCSQTELNCSLQSQLDIMQTINTSENALENLLEKQFNKFKSDLNLTLNKITDSIKSLEDKCNDLEKENKELKDEMLKLTMKCNAQSMPDTNSIISEITDQTARKNNIIIYGIVDENNKEKDKTNVCDLLGLLVPAVAPLTNFRLGKYNINSTRPRPIKVVLTNKKESSEIFKNIYKLKDDVKYSNVSISSDRSKLQRENLKKIIEDLDLRKQNGENDLTIKYFNGQPKIVTSKKTASKNP